jgi:TRAP-type C4-dicarboxylate transport system substrate-binding protein
VNCRADLSRNRTNVALIGTMVPAMKVLAMPFLFRSVEHLQKVPDGPIGNEIPVSFEPSIVRLIERIRKVQ